MKKTYSLLLVFCFILALSDTGYPANAASIRLNKTKYTMYMGKTYKLKIKGTKGKIKWTSSKKKVAKVSSSGKVTALKVGKTKITAKVKNKKLTCNITVKKRPLGKGTKASPKSAYASNTLTFYEEDKKIGKITIKLERYESGNNAAKLAKANSTNPIPAANQEYIYFRFRIKYISGFQTINAKDIFNYNYNIFGDNSTKQLTNLDWGFYFENVADLKQTLLSPGNTVVCSKAILISKGHSPITYRIQTGKNSYTWFTTEK